MPNILLIDLLDITQSITGNKKFICEGNYFKFISKLIIYYWSYNMNIRQAISKDLDDIKEQIRIASEHFLHGDFED